MNFLELKIIRQLGTGIVYFTSFLVLLMGLWLWGSVTTVPESASLASEGRQLRRPNSVSDVERLSKTEVAGPSSAVDNVRADIKVETLALECLHEGAHIKLQSVARQVRLKAGLCHGHHAELSKSNVVNRANGFEATLFNLESGGFSSDYIHLVDGDNQIVMQVQDDNGKTVSTDVTISRPSKL